MNLQAGQQLGSFRLVEKIGQGGMGVVWKAVDATLGREVAIKFLPDPVASDPDRMARFEREAKLLASLNHAGIATIHGLRDVGGLRFLEMELVAGRDLSRRLAEGPLPIDEALPIARQVASALEAAHESGVVHRDLKPANIQVSDDGVAKILDFGLAKALDPDLESGHGSLSPTLTSPATRAGVVLGTAAYMSPEQAKGKHVDRRADIWAFGCVLYEMLAGRSAFSGDGVSETMAAVIMSPVNLDALPASVPASIRRLVRRCLEKDPHRRLRDIGEARITIEETLSGVTAEPAATTAAEAPSASHWRTLALGAVAVGLVAAVSALIWTLRPTPPTAGPMRRFLVAANGPFSSVVAGRLIALSPDGSRVAYMGQEHLWIRSFDRLEARQVMTPETPGFLFWSPDSAWLGYAAAGKLWKVPADGGESTLLADQPGALAGGGGATWSPKGQIILARGDTGLFTAPARGGEFKMILQTDPNVETDFHEPYALPDESVLFTAHRKDGRPDTLALLAGGVRKDLLRIEGQDIWHPVYSPTGHILFRRHPKNQGIWALPFSLSRHEVVGEAFLVVPDGDIPSVSADGTMVHVIGRNVPAVQLVWAGRDGKVLAAIGQPQQQAPWPALSPDGHRVAVAAKEEGGTSDIWIHDVDRGTMTRLTFVEKDLTDHSWSPSGDQILFEVGSSPPFTMMIVPADGSGKPRELGVGLTSAFTPDGRGVVFGLGNEKQEDFDLYSMDLQGGGGPVPLLKAAGDQYWPRVSPDGRYLVYTSNETGKDQIFLTRYPKVEGKWQVSVAGGNWPLWGGLGDRIYYAEGDTLMEVQVATTPTLHLGAPRALFKRKPFGRQLPFGWPPGFDVSADGERFVFCQSTGDEVAGGGFIVVENWFAPFRQPQ